MKSIKEMIHNLFNVKKSTLELNKGTPLHNLKKEIDEAMKEEDFSLRDWDDYDKTHPSFEINNLGSDLTPDQMRDYIRRQIERDKYSQQQQQPKLSYEDFYKDLVFKEKVIHSIMFNKSINKQLFMSEGKYRIDLQEAFLKKLYEIHHVEYEKSMQHYYNSSRRSAIFNGTSTFNQPISQWDTTKVTDLSSLGMNPCNEIPLSAHDPLGLNDISIKGKQKQ